MITTLCSADFSPLFASFAHERSDRRPKNFYNVDLPEAGRGSEVILIAAFEPRGTGAPIR